MSMIGYLLQVTLAELEEILADSGVLEQKLSPPDDSEPEGLLDIDKTWEGIYYLLNGYPMSEAEKAQPPMSWVFFGGAIVDEKQDLGYGPATYITADQVALLSAELDNLSTGELRSRYNGKEMNDAGIYPEIWQEDDALPEVVDNFERIREFFKVARIKGNAVVTFIG